MVDLGTVFFILLGNAVLMGLFLIYLLKISPKLTKTILEKQIIPYLTSSEAIQTFISAILKQFSDRFQAINRGMMSGASREMKAINEPFKAAALKSKFPMFELIKDQITGIFPGGEKWISEKIKDMPFIPYFGEIAAREAINIVIPLIAQQPQMAEALGIDLKSLGFTPEVLAEIAKAPSLIKELTKGNPLGQRATLTYDLAGNVKA